MWAEIDGRGSQMNKPKLRDEIFEWMDEGIANNLRVICWYCPKCGLEISKYAEHCEKCSEPLDWSVEE